MDDNQAIRQQWDDLLTEHRALVTAYVQALGTRAAPLIAPQVRAITINVSALSELLALPLDQPNTADPSA